MKYIIDIPDDAEWIQVCKRAEGGVLNEKVIYHSDFMPYTEPDLNPLVDEAVETIENEVWELADYMCRMSQTEKSRCFGFSYPSEVTTNLSYQEAKDKYEAWMKQEDYRQDREKVIALADDIGIHNLYTLVCDIRGE